MEKSIKKQLILEAGYLKRILNKDGYLLYFVLLKFSDIHFKTLAKMYKIYLNEEGFRPFQGPPPPSISDLLKKNINNQVLKGHLPKLEERINFIVKKLKLELITILKINYPKPLIHPIQFDVLWKSQPYFSHKPDVPPPQYLIKDFINETNRDKKEQILTSLTNTYKIHLMAKKEEIEEVVVELANLINANKDLQQNIAAFKIIAILNKIVIYIFKGKEATQIVLNKIFDKFKDRQGTGEEDTSFKEDKEDAVKYNKKVTNLIYVTQGNRDDKNDLATGKIDNYTIDDFFKGPTYIYFRNDIQQRYGEGKETQNFELDIPKNK